MKLKQIVIDKTDLTLTKEKKTIKYGEEFEVTDETRANEILNTTFKGKPVAEVVVDGNDINVGSIEAEVVEDKPKKRAAKKTNK